MRKKVILLVKVEGINVGKLICWHLRVEKERTKQREEIPIYTVRK
jgi:hypothetical protein